MNWISISLFRTDPSFSHSRCRIFTVKKFHSDLIQQLFQAHPFRQDVVSLIVIQLCNLMLAFRIELLSIEISPCLDATNFHLLPSFHDNLGKLRSQVQETLLSINKSPIFG